MKHILVPTDFSDAAGKALDYAVGLAGAFGARLTLFSAYHLTPYAPEMYLYVGKEELGALKKSTAERLNKLAAKAGRRTAKPVSILTGEGLAAPGILGAMKKLKPDLVVMGTRGMGALERSVFGSVTLEVVRRSEQPVLIVPELAKDVVPKRIVYATDYHDSDPGSIRFLAGIARKLDAEIIVLHVADGEVKEDFEQSFLEELGKEVKKATRYRKVTFQIITGPHTVSAIEDFVREHRVGIVALAREKRSAFLRILVPSTTRKMIYHSEVPLLVFDARDGMSEDC